MLSRIRIFIIFLFTASIGFGQNRIPPPPCYANGNNGAEGVIGYGSFLHNYYGNDIQLFFGAQQEEVLFDDVLVFYIATSAPGRTVLDETVDDAADGYRAAITNSDAFGYGSIITFPSGFQVSYAIAIDSNSGGLYAIPSSGNVGDGDLNYIASVNSTLSSNTQTGFEISFNASDIGIGNEEPFFFVGVYVGHNGYTYDEGYGDGILAGTEGNDDILFSTARLLSNNVGCQTVLNTSEYNNSSIDARFIDNDLHISGINANVDIVAYDLLGREVVKINKQINGNAIIPIDLLKNQLHFIVIEKLTARKILKVIPN